MKIISIRIKRLLVFCGIVVALLSATYWIWFAEPTGRRKAAALFEELVACRKGRTPNMLQDMASRVADDIPVAKQVIERLRRDGRDSADILRDIETLGPEALPLFRSKLISVDRERRWCAAIACFRVADPNSVVSMAYLLDDTDDMMQCVAIGSFARVGGPASMEVLGEKLDDEAYNRVFDLYLGDQIGGTGLVKMNARSLIAYYLGRFAGAEAIPALEKAAKSSDDQLSRTASWALERIGEKRGISRRNGGGETGETRSGTFSASTSMPATAPGDWRPSTSASRR